MVKYKNPRKGISPRLHPALALPLPGPSPASRTSSEVTVDTSPPASRVQDGTSVGPRGWLVRSRAHTPGPGGIRPGAWEGASRENRVRLLEAKLGELARDAGASRPRVFGSSRGGGAGGHGSPTRGAGQLPAVPGGRYL